ncbi:MAG: mechanosensitive ion channel [Holosporales bacterium]|jgi:small-conductance mechanosensitive channel/CRP-like cAMP-binding protein|nr:mechanosensitive ion channel [Holosporales bacterium]
MNKKIVINLFVGIALVLLLVSIFVFGDKISPDNVGEAYAWEQFTKAILIVLIAIVIIRLILLALIRPIEEKRGMKISGLFKDAIAVVILSIGAVVIIRNIYGESVFGMLSVMAGSGVVIGIAAKNFLEEVIAGIIIDFQNDFRVGDWVKFPDGSIAQIIKTKITSVSLITADETLLHVSNTTFTNQPMINLNKPQTAFYSSLNVVLDHDVPIERARRILYAASCSAEGVYEQTVLVVAEGVQQIGILFGIYFKIPNQDVWLEVKHQVISSIIKALHEHKLKVCEISGQFKIQNIDHASLGTHYDKLKVPEVTSESTTLKLSGLLKDCSESLQKHFANRMEKIIFKSGEVIVSQGEEGDTMFIIAEGIVDVIVSVSAVDSDGQLLEAKQSVANLVDGDYFGEMSLLCGEKRNATVIAKTDVVVYMVRRGTVKSFVQEYPDFARKLSVSIIERKAENEAMRSNAIDQMTVDKKNETVSQFMAAFKNFLGV